MLDRIQSERNVLWHAIWRLNKHISEAWEHDRTTASVAGRAVTHRVRTRLLERLSTLNRYERWYLRLTYGA